MSADDAPSPAESAESVVPDESVVPAEIEVPGEHGAADPSDGPAVAPHPVRRPWTATLTVLRIIIVLALSGIGYLLLIPVTHTDRARLSHLVVARTGLAAFPGKALQSAEINLSQAQINSLTAAARAEPRRTGAWTSQWGVRSTVAHPAIEAVAFLAPDEGYSNRIFTEVRNVSLAADAESAQGFDERSRFGVAGVPASVGVTYTTRTPTSPTLTTLVVTMARVGRITVLTEGIGSTDIQAQVESLLHAEYHLARSEGNGFSLEVTHEPTTATIIWAAGTAVVVLLVGFGPLYAGWLRRRSAERRQTELDAMVRGHEAITKHRRVGT